MDEINWTSLLEENGLAREQAKRYGKKRSLYESIFSAGRAFVGIAGLRGIGKSTLLKQRLLENDRAFYVSLDNHPTLDLFELAKKINEHYHVQELLLDEISYSKEWAQALKRIYDFLPIKVYFTTSVALEIQKTAADLSRRAIIVEMHPFSFREFLSFYHGITDTTPISLADINDAAKIGKIAQYDYLFSEYVHGALIPAFLEDKNPKIFSNILERIIERDLVFALNFSGDDILYTRKMVEYISNAGVDDVSYSSISRNVGITAYKAAQYVNALEKAFVLNVIKPIGSNVTKEPKILFALPFRRVYRKTSDENVLLGITREEFFVQHMKMNGYEIYYLKGKKGKKRPDYQLRENNQTYLFEIGGKQKNRSQLSAHTHAHQYILTYPSNLTMPYRPLLVAGFLR